MSFNSPVRVIGIDPGVSGAYAYLDENGRVIEVDDVPVMARTHGKGNEINAQVLHARVEELARSAYERGFRVTAVIEAVSAMPGQGVTAMFHFGESFGVVKGLLGALGIPYKLVTPAVWKRKFGLLCKEKDAARTLAITGFPEAAEKLSRKKDVGRADAILIASSYLS